MFAISSDNNKNKESGYFKLVDQRKKCKLCEHTLTNPSTCKQGVFDIQRHIGPWTQWQHNLNAKLLIVAQDWGGEGYYIKNQGIEKDTNITNQAICELLASIGIHAVLPNQPQPESSVYLTNAILCLRSGNGLSGPTPPDQCFANCSKKFLLPQIQLVNPKVVATLGHKAYSSVSRAYDKHPKSLMRDAVGETIRLTEATSLIPLFHPGYFGRFARPFQKQKEDWQIVARVLKED